jgi:hypothetical protein
MGEIRRVRSGSLRRKNLSDGPPTRIDGSRERFDGVRCRDSDGGDGRRTRSRETLDSTSFNGSASVDRTGTVGDPFDGRRSVSGSIRREPRCLTERRSDRRSSVRSGREERRQDKHRLHADIEIERRLDEEIVPRHDVGVSKDSERYGFEAEGEYLPSRRHAVRADHGGSSSCPHRHRRMFDWFVSLDDIGKFILRCGGPDLDRLRYAVRSFEVNGKRYLSSRDSNRGKRDLPKPENVDRESGPSRIHNERESTMDGEALFRAMASGEMDQVASALPPEHRKTVDDLKRHSDNGDIEAILGVARAALDRTAELLVDLKTEEETKDE